MNRRSFLSLPLTATLARPQTKPLNVVVLLADDLGWADTGFHGSEIQTPNLDRLRAQSLELSRFYSCPVCSPTRSSLMTGRSPMRYGIIYSVVRPWSNYGIPLDEHLMPQSFQAAGYQTAMAGKWHMGHGDRRYFPNARGFQSSYGHFNGAIDYYTHIRDGGLDWHRDGKTLREEGYSTELIGQEAVRRIEQRDRNKPLLLYVPFNSPHSPLQAPANLIGKYADIADKQRRTFAAMVDSMDTQIGRIMGAIDKQGIAGNTLLMFFSDNGGPVNLGARNSPLRGMKATTWEGGIRVPALMRLPGILPSGAQSRQVMSALDLFPTLAAAAAVKPLNKHPFDGRNLWKQLSSATAVDREDLFFAVGQASVYHAVFHGPWKLVLEQKQGAAGPENFLFRIAEDPNETTNLASSFPAVVKDLAARIEAWKRLHPAGGVQFSNKPPDGWKAPAQWAEAAVGG